MPAASKDAVQQHRQEHEAVNHDLHDGLFLSVSVIDKG
jgi:hypothetical protein